MKIQSGVAAGSKDHIEWELHKKAGPRSWSTTIVFEEGFAVPPTVVVTLCAFDVHKDRNLRLSVRAINADHRQFTLEFRTWDDSYVHSAKASWIAYGK